MMNSFLRVFLLILISFAPAFLNTKTYAKVVTHSVLDDPPEVFIKVDPTGGFSVTPLTTPPNTTTITYTLIPESGATPISGSVGTNETITVNEPWTGDFAEIELCYLNSANQEIDCNLFRVGDGVILDDPIVMEKKEGGENEACAICGTDFTILNSGTLAELGSINETINYLIFVDNYKFYFQTEGGSLEYVRQCEGETLETEFMKNGIRFFFEGASLFTIEASDLGDTLFLHLQNHNKSTVHKFIQACERT